MTSNISSFIWNANPNFSPNFSNKLISSFGAFASIAPEIIETLISAPVFFICIYLSSSSLIFLPSFIISTICPPIIPSGPDASAIFCAAIKASFPYFNENFIIKFIASFNNVSPAKTAISSPYTLWLVGFPLLKSSLSIQGKSSWINEYVWIISIAAENSIISFQLFLYIL